MAGQGVSGIRAPKVVIWLKIAVGIAILFGLAYWYSHDDKLGQ